MPWRGIARNASPPAWMTISANRWIVRRSLLSWSAQQPSRLLRTGIRGLLDLQRYLLPKASKPKSAASTHNEHMSANPSSQSQLLGDQSLLIFDRAASLDQTGNDPELLDQLIAVFLEQLPTILLSLAQAVQCRDAQAIQKTAHALASSVSVLSAPLPRDLARRLELMGANSDLACVEEVHLEVLRGI